MVQLALLEVYKFLEQLANNMPDLAGEDQGRCSPAGALAAKFLQLSRDLQSISYDARWIFRTINLVALVDVAQHAIDLWISHDLHMLEIGTYLLEVVTWALLVYACTRVSSATKDYIELMTYAWIEPGIGHSESGETPVGSETSAQLQLQLQLLSMPGAHPTGWYITFLRQQGVVLTKNRLWAALLSAVCNLLAAALKQCLHQS